MQSRIHSKNLDIQDDQKAYIEERVERLSKYADRIGDEATIVDVEVHKNKHKGSDKMITLEMTIHAPHATIRAEVNELTIEAASDAAFEKLKAQIERYKSKDDRRTKTGKIMPEPTLEPVLDAVVGETDITAVANETEGMISKRKTFRMDRACSDSEAIEQLELLGHDFFLYKSSDTGRLCVVYKRKDGNYGILEVEE